MVQEREPVKVVRRHQGMTVTAFVGEVGGYKAGVIRLSRILTPEIESFPDGRIKADSVEIGRVRQALDACKAASKLRPKELQELTRKP